MTTTEAQEVLGLRSVNTVEAWAKRGILRSQMLPSGELEVRRDDLARWAHYFAKEAPYADEQPMTEEELRDMTEARGAKNPWDK